MRPTSMSNIIAKVTNVISIEHAGHISDPELERLLRDFNISSPGAVSNYKEKLQRWGYLIYDREEGTYHLTAESMKTGTITISVRPSLNASEFRRDLVDRYAAYSGIIEVSEVKVS